MREHNSDRRTPLRLSDLCSMCNLRVQKRGGVCAVCERLYFSGDARPKDARGAGVTRTEINLATNEPAEVRRARSRRGHETRKARDARSVPEPEPAPVYWHGEHRVVWGRVVEGGFATQGRSGSSMSTAAQADVFGAGAGPGKKVTMEDLYNLYTREVCGVPEGWRWDEISRLPEHAPEGSFRLRGSVVPIGPRTGRPNWRKRDRSTDRTLFISFKEFDAWHLARAEHLDECMKCRGEGQEYYGWSRAAGRLTRTCRKCGGTGKHFNPEVASCSPS